MKVFFLIASLFYLVPSSAQSFVTRDIKSFGARGDGSTNDQLAFEKAAEFFNRRGGKGKLVISKGVYRVGQQDFSGTKDAKAAYLGHDVLYLNGVKNLTIEGRPGAVLRYVDSLRFGAFNPETGKPHPNKKYFTQWSFAASIGHCIRIEASSKVLIKNLELDGNNKAVIRGGVFGDRGIQLPHYGIFIRNSNNVTVEKAAVHHFALDGISVANKPAGKPDEIKLLQSNFEYNSRQGFSWIGGNGLKAKECSFSHTGRGAFASPPGAGVDIEAEVGPIRNGKFEDCSMVNNAGVGMVADNGDSREVEFKGCTFWGVTTWSVWVNRPAFTFKDCKIYGSFVHGYNAERDEDATRFVGCHFEDKPFEGREPYGNFLVESNGRRRLTFENCRFESHTKKLLWVAGSASWAPDEKYQFRNCRFLIHNENLPRKDYIAVIRGIRYSNCSFTYSSPLAKGKKYYLNSCCENFNVDEGGNKIIYPQE